MRVGNVGCNAIDWPLPTFVPRLQKKPIVISSLSTNPFTGISIIIPAYHSMATLEELVARLSQVLPTQAPKFEAIIVNDGSLDGTWEVIEKLSQSYPWVRGLSLMRNFGQHNAILAGVRAARFEIIVTMDDDLQHPPEEIPTLLAALSPARDVVYGCPHQEAHGILRDLASVVTKLTLQSATGAETARMVSAFRAFRTQLRDSFSEYNHPYVNIDVLLTWGSARFGATTVRRDSRAVGKSAYTMRKLVRHSMNMLTGFSVIPLQFASIVGFIFTLFGMAILAYVVGQYVISGTNVPGFPFLASMIAIFSGAQLFALGVIGEYLARMHFRSMNKPAYTVRNQTDSCPR